MDMTKEDCEKWLVELRSGKHKQGRTLLKNSVGDMCCLGVYASTSGKFKEAKQKGVKGNTLFTHPKERGGFGCFLPTSEITGFWQNQLISLNDRHEASFLEIADYIEKNILPAL